VRALVCKELGPLDGLSIEEVPDPRPEKGQVVISVRAAGVNYVDGLICQGRYQMKPQTPYVPGGEIAGVVDEVGKGVTAFSVGDRVFAMTGFGAFAERVPVRDSSVSRVPDGLDFGRAASFVQSYSTAWYALIHRAALRRDEWLLVLGAGGGIGLAAVDVGVGVGAKVVAAASSDERLALAKSLGPQGLVNYEEEDLKTRARELSDGGVDVVLDPVGGTHSEPALRSTRRLGRFCVIGFAAGVIPSIPLNQVLLNNRTLVGVDWGAWAMSDPTANRRLLDDVIAAVENGTLHPVAPTERPFDDAPQVMSELLDRRIVGKVVLVP